MEERNSFRAKRLALLTNMSPEEILEEKKKQIFRFLQKELKNNTGYETEESELEAE